MSAMGRMQTLFKCQRRQPAGNWQGIARSWSAPAPSSGQTGIDGQPDRNLQSFPTQPFNNPCNNRGHDNCPDCGGNLFRICELIFLKPGGPFFTELVTTSPHPQLCPPSLLSACCRQWHRPVRARRPIVPSPVFTLPASVPVKRASIFI